MSCDGKVGLETYKQAATVVQRYQTKERPGRHAYHCKYCGKWHIGTDNGRIQVQKKRKLQERKHG